MTDDGQCELIPCKRVLEVLSILSSKQSQHGLAALLEDFASSHEQYTGTGTSSLVCYALLLATEFQRVDASAGSVKEALEIVEKVFIAVCRSIAHDGHISHSDKEEDKKAAVNTVTIEESERVCGFEECLGVDEAEDVDWFFDGPAPHDNNSGDNDSTNSDDVTSNQHKQEYNPRLTDEVDDNGVDDGDDDDDDDDDDDVVVGASSLLNMQLARGLDHSFPWEFEFTTSTDNAGATTSPSTSATASASANAMGLSLPMRLAWTAAEIMWGPLPLSPSAKHYSPPQRQPQSAMSDGRQGLGYLSEPLSLDRLTVHTLAGINTVHSGVHGDTIIFLCDRRTAHASVSLQGKGVVEWVDG